MVKVIKIAGIDALIKKLTPTKETETEVTPKVVEAPKTTKKKTTK